MDAQEKLMPVQLRAVVAAEVRRFLFPFFKF